MCFRSEIPVIGHIDSMWPITGIADMCWDTYFFNVLLVQFRKTEAAANIMSNFNLNKRIASIDNLEYDVILNVKAIW